MTEIPRTRRDRMEYDAILIAQIIDVLAMAKMPMHTTAFIGRKIYGFNFGGEGYQYRKLLRMLNKLHETDILFCVGTRESNVWMLQKRDFRVAAPNLAGSILDAELPY